MITTPSVPLIDELAALDPNSPPSPRDAQELCRRAKAAHRMDVIPSWLISVARRNIASGPEKSSTYSNEPVSTSTQPQSRRPLPSFFAPTLANTEKLLKAKSDDSGIALPVLRTVFKRGLCEASTAKLPTDPYEYAQARVNSFIRLCQGDYQAREDDADLLDVAT